MPSRSRTTLEASAVLNCYSRSVHWVPPTFRRCLSAVAWSQTFPPVNRRGLLELPTSAPHSLWLQPIHQRLKKDIVKPLSFVKAFNFISLYECMPSFGASSLQQIRPQMIRRCYAISSLRPVIGNPDERFTSYESSQLLASGKMWPCPRDSKLQEP